MRDIRRMRAPVRTIEFSQPVPESEARAIVEQFGGTVPQRKEFIRIEVAGRPVTNAPRAKRIRAKSMPVPALVTGADYASDALGGAQ